MLKIDARENESGPVFSSPSLCIDMRQTCVRDANEADIEAIHQIYAEHVRL
jgi:hypothetical protein